MARPRNAPVIAVIGASRCTAREAQLAEDVGHELARRGAVLVCGGLDGVMEAACRGAKSTNGLTIGILPGVERDGANEWVDVTVVTGLGWARNPIVALNGDAAIAVGGAYGTLPEIAYARMHGRPLVGAGDLGPASPQPHGGRRHPRRRSP